jgi:hypothetical protein
MKTFKKIIKASIILVVVGLSSCIIAVHDHPYYHHHHDWHHHYWGYIPHGSQPSREVITAG